MTWRKIETAPKDGRQILVAWTSPGYEVGVTRWQEKDPDEDGWHDEDGGAWYDLDCVETNPPSHWMPLPPPPQD